MSVKPYLKWAGGKRQLLPEIRKYIPASFDLYVEPFVGAGAVLFDLQPKRAVINDANRQLIMTYEVIRDDVETLIAALKEHAAKNNIAGMRREFGKAGVCACVALPG